MFTLIFATNNDNKVDEVRSMLGIGFEIVTLKESGIEIDIPEPHNTLEENASEKSRTIHTLTGKNCFGEDTGLEVRALQGAPGVKSARYAGEAVDFKKNTYKLLKNLKDNDNREARFRTIISLIIDGGEYQFEGICNGTILREEKGSFGFGYDTVFAPEGSNRSFGEMRLEEKNEYSHRKKAIMKLIKFLQDHYAPDKD